MADTAVVTTPRPWGLVAWGHASLGFALVAFLTVNGVSGTPGAAVAVTAVLLSVGFLLPAVATIRVAQAVGEGPARRGLVAHGCGLGGLLLGFGCIFTDVLVLDGVGAALVAVSGAASLAGVVAFRRGVRSRAGDATRAALTCLVAGTSLLALGALVVAVADLAYVYPHLIVETSENAYVDIGATVAALGCVLVTYATVVLRRAGA